MKFQDSQKRLRIWGLVATTALATVVLAAAADPDAAWARIKALPPDQRTKLLDGLRRFDLTLSAEQRASLRSIDHQLWALEPAERTRYLETLERYHNWLIHLPDKLQEEIRSAVPSDRMAVVRKIATTHPVRREDSTLAVLRLVDVGDLSPFDIAWVYKTWVKATQSERASLEQAPVAKRRVELRKLAKHYEIPGEVKPADFDEELWVTRLESHYRSANPILYDELIQRKNEAPAKKGPAISKEELEKREERRNKILQEILRRQAINYYYMDASHPRRPVDGDKLAQFVAALPPWIPSAFDQFSPDEARRRLSVVYRLVFGKGEITAAAVGAKAPAGPGASSKAMPGSEALKKPASAAKGETGAPF
jgi:hypothetical protein